ncbi:MAG: putative LPS assembly protein LptD [Gemmatimonadota bacterium]
MSLRWRSFAVVLILAVVPAIVFAQQRPPVPQTRADSLRADSLRADSLRRAAADSALLRRGDRTDTLRLLADSLRRAAARDTTDGRISVTWAPLDSMGAVLLAREGYSVTRYQGTSVEFRARDNVMYLVGKRAAVQRDSMSLIGDTIQFNDSTEVIHARGDTLLLRDPAQGEDVIAQGSLRYDINSRLGVVRNVRTTVESGQRWVVHGREAAFKGDSTGARESVFYARDGWLTSCEEDEPHYHFGAGEMKLISKNVMVVRPAILYLADIPVLWLPFVFNDMRTGRRSGVISPNIGINQVFRQSAFMRRTIEDIGYYFAINDYLDAQLSMDWRSNARSTDFDPGYIKVNGIAQYRWKDRFIDGSVGVSRHNLRNGESNEQYSLRHSQRFSERTSFSADFNYFSNTTIQRQTTFNPNLALQSVTSNARLSTGRGPLSIDLGASQKQWPGRDQLDRTFPTLSVSSKPIEAGEWLTWRPSLAISNAQSFNIDQVGDFAFRYFATPGGGLDSARVKRDTRNSSVRFDTPIQLFGFDLRNTFSVTDVVNDFPEERTVYTNPADTTSKQKRVFARTYVTGVDWDFGFSLPSFLPGTWNVSPSLSFQKVDGRSPLVVRTERTGNRWVRQNFRPAAGVSISPKFFGFFPGFGPIEQIRHAVEPNLTYQWSPRGSVSDEFLAANGDVSQGYLGNNPQSIVSLGFTTSFEAKLREDEDATPLPPPGADSILIPSAGRPSGPQLSRKIKLLSLNFTTLSYDFVRARESRGGTGLTNRSFDWSARSDLLPGFDVGVSYSLFQGDPISDTAVFKPYREGVRANLSLDGQSAIVRGIARLIGIRVPTEEELRRQAAIDRQQQETQRRSPASNQLLPGRSLSRGLSTAGLQVPSGQGWRLNLSLTSQRQRPPVGDNVRAFDPREQCLIYRDDPFQEGLCLQQFSQGGFSDGLPFNETTRGGTFFVSPPQTNINGSTSFHVTENWAAQWQTSYDFETKAFASHIVSLQRRLHDWDAVFAFTRSPNGNFAFNFFIALRAQPDIKFDYDRPSFPRGYSGRRF